MSFTQIKTYRQKPRIGGMICNVPLVTDYIPFGKAQVPSLTDYADGIDTINFLTKL